MSSSQIPTDEIMLMMAPDGYYSYFGIKKGTDIDEDEVKRKYRKLSLKHHPDKPSGDAETFKALNRAKKVLANPKLRKQYDVLGLDLDDDDAVKPDHDDVDDQSQNEGIVQEVASMALAFVLQLGLKTVLLAVTSVFIIRYRLTLILALAFLCFVAYKIHATNAATTTPDSLLDFSSPFILGMGLCIMYSSPDTFFYFWIGESMVVAMFIYNSTNLLEQSRNLMIIIAVSSLLIALFFRGKFWNYAIVIGLQGFLALFIALAFPIMEMVLEAVLNEKLKKVGEKVRSHHQQMERFYAAKAKS